MYTDTSYSKSSEDDLIYNINNLEEFIIIKFREYKELSTNVEFSLNSAKNFLRQRDLKDEKYKVILYYKNKFVYTLSFNTPFLQASEKLLKLLLTQYLKQIRSNLSSLL
ncbi:2505_t:CDS:2 [Cetraspora pellucida]|uniref:2505_t:CDS:1 n=1 Tax=Cetraspora pellucida TaxID=1433469 RepID=A0A9N9C1U3_9GLOM|nr:2505_t:CDS:2 [Cetraspora pellucida]